MSSADDLYPTPCAFCKISQAYPATRTTNPIPQNPDPDKLSPACHLILSTPHVLAFLDIMPMAPGHILLTTRDHYRTLADLHKPVSQKQKKQDWVSRREDSQRRTTASELGRWLPVLSRALCKVTEIEDWNVVQNNGARAAQVVPHVHFHLIPRYQEGRIKRDGGGNGGNGNLSEGMMRSWRMFGRGSREDLDDEEGAELAGRLRRALEEEIAADVGNDDGGVGRVEAKSKL